MDCDRESCTVTVMFVGMCRSVTRVETLFTFCPPGPDARLKISSNSASSRWVIGFTIWPLAPPKIGWFRARRQVRPAYLRIPID